MDERRETPELEVHEIPDELNERRPGDTPCEDIMKNALLLLLLVPSILLAQTPVDRLARTLDSLSMISFDEWKMSPDLKNRAP